MRIRYALTCTALGAVLALGAMAAPAQAVPSEPVAQAKTPAGAQGYVVAGQYLTEYECGIAGYSQPLPWYCQRYGVVWYLFVKIS
ncbi:hypothetical protein JBE04_14355 [Streptomyces sp. PRKS01-29]|nr:hypothetical protein [Streptomyces sabulosicollis]MBI0295614.1 hypothetical protein [Streptomyces sabulosicollis]